MSVFSVNTNLGANAAYNALQKSNAEGIKAAVRIATKSQINTVSDDVSGFNVGNSLKSKVKLMQSAQGNISAAKNMLGTAESALLLVKDKITQIRQYVADASDPTKDREALAENIKSLGEEIKNIFETTKFNDTQLLVGGYAGGTSGTLTSNAKSFTFQTGADVSDRITLDFASGLASAKSTVYDGSAKVSGGAHSDVANAISSFTSMTGTTGADFGLAIASLSDGGTGSIISKFEIAVDKALGKIGNFVQRLDVKDEYLTAAITNATGTIGRIFDTNMALEQLNSTKAQLGSNLATMQLAQLNQQPSNVMGLFR